VRLHHAGHGFHRKNIKFVRAILTKSHGQLAVDSADAVRRALSRWFYETVNALCNGANVDVLKGTMASELDDDSIRFKKAAFVHIIETVVLLSKVVRSISGEKVSDVEQMTASSKANWRISQDSALHVWIFCNTFPTLGRESSLSPLLQAIVDTTGPTESRQTRT
jgi:hypothetical protein